MNSTSGSAFRPATAETLAHLTRHNRDERCTFLIASNYINAPAAQVGYLLSELAGRGSGRTDTHVSYLVNSGLEALSGAIKLARHTAVRAGKDTGGWVLLLDEKGRYRDFMDPVGRGAEEALIPHVVCVDSAARALREFVGRTWAAVIVVREEHTDLRHRDIRDLVATCRRGGGLTVLCCTELDADRPDLFDNPVEADVLVLGENLTDRQAPFGAFTLTSSAHQVWRNDVDCFAQTSTFGGNTLCASLVRETLRRHGHVDERQAAVLRAIESDRSETVRYWGLHINPNMAKLATTFGLDVDIRRAAGGRFTTAEGWDVIDCGGGVGSNLRGHNPPDLVPDVFEQHDPGHDYFADLERKLIDLTGLSHAFPAVSGATANDTAVTLALLANPDRRKVVTFRGNYGGKTLFSLNLSKHGPQQTESDPDAFRPYYRDLVYLDPFADDAPQRLSALLRSGEVALVWFELIQGAMCGRLPDAVLDVISGLREEYGFLVGVDEVLSGGWRSGEHYLAHQGIVDHADIVTLGKTTSDMTLPSGIAMVSADVYARAAERAPDHVARLAAHFRNGLAAHISLHAIETADDKDERARQRAAYAELVAGLNTAFRTSKVFGDVAGSGAHLRLTMNQRYFPFHHRSKIGNLLEMTLSDLIYRRCRVFLPALRIMHRVTADPAELAELGSRLAAGTRGITPAMVYRYAFGRAFAPALPRVGALLRGSAATPRL
ncbi:aminotransferase class III-fold pyridoxal phosphate-dependent enzyme [Streptomyces sp. NPDC050211]|uniref:aminotransferase class III-fold pyridoxal phosphate-dependent enzyme n=1 Tax=Streptomyces sp. NPDC050211 TaxID=3154932 RepID=UPI003440BF81